MAVLNQRLIDGTCELGYEIFHLMTFISLNYLGDEADVMTCSLSGAFWEDVPTSVGCLHQLSSGMIYLHLWCTGLSHCLLLLSYVSCLQKRSCYNKRSHRTHETTPNDLIMRKARWVKLSIKLLRVANHISIRIGLYDVV